MTPDKVEEIVEEIMKEYQCIDPSCDQQGCIPHQVSETEWEPEQCEYCYVVRFPYKEKLTQTLTKYHQDLMREVVEEIGAKIEEANFAEKVAERTGDGTAVYEVQEVVRQIQTIIKSFSE